MCPMNRALMSLLGLSLGHRSKASLTAREKISRVYKPSCLPNLDRPALIMETSDFPFKLSFPYDIFYAVSFKEYASYSALLKLLLRSTCGRRLEGTVRRSEKPEIFG